MLNQPEKSISKVLVASAFVSFFCINACGSKHSKKSPQEIVDQEPIDIENRWVHYKAIRDTQIEGENGLWQQYRSINDDLAQWVDAWQESGNYAKNPTESENLAKATNEISRRVMLQYDGFRALLRRSIDLKIKNQKLIGELLALKAPDPVGAKSIELDEHIVTLAKIIHDSSEKIIADLQKINRANHEVGTILNSLTTSNFVRESLEAEHPAIETIATQPICIDSLRKLRLEAIASQFLPAESNGADIFERVHQDIEGASQAASLASQKNQGEMDLIKEKYRLWLSSLAPAQR